MRGVEVRRGTRIPKRVAVDQMETTSDRNPEHYQVGFPHLERARRGEKMVGPDLT